MRWPHDYVLTWQSGFAPAQLPCPDLSRWPLFAPVATPRPFDPPTDRFDPPPVWRGALDGHDARSDDREEVRTVTITAPDEVPAEDDIMAALFGDQPELLDWHDQPPDAS